MGLPLADGLQPILVRNASQLPKADRAKKSGRLLYLFLNLEASCWPPEGGLRLSGERPGPVRSRRSLLSQPAASQPAGGPARAPRLETLRPSPGALPGGGPA